MRRAIILRRSDADPGYIDLLIDTHQLEVAYTAVADIEHPRLSAMIAARYAAEYQAEVVVAAHLTGDTVRGDVGGRTIVAVCDVVTSDDVVTLIAP